MFRSFRQFDWFSVLHLAFRKWFSVVRPLVGDVVIFDSLTPHKAILDQAFHASHYPRILEHQNPIPDVKHDENGRLIPHDNAIPCHHNQNRNVDGEDDGISRDGPPIDLNRLFREQ